MYKVLLLCLSLMKTLCVEGNVHGPWSYFNQDEGIIMAHDLSPVASFDNIYQSEGSFVNPSNYFLIRSDKTLEPQVETGFVPSFGNIADQVKPGQPFQKKHSPNKHRSNHRAKPPGQHKRVVTQSSTQVNKYRNNPYSPGVKQSSSIYKPSFIVGSHLSQIRDDPVYHKVRSNVKANANRLKIKENYPNGVNGDVLEKQQNEYFEPQFEKYVVQNEPSYYKPQKHNINYDKIQMKNRYPLPNHGHVKIHPNAYKPLKSRINVLKAKQHSTFSEGKNDYPENKNKEKVTADEQKVLSGGRDILDSQRLRFENQKQNFNDEFSSHVNKYHDHQLLPHSSDQQEDDADSGTDFVPIKTYAQVRHSETIKHLPRDAAYQDAETFDEVLNAPRLKEAVKTSKAQTVYTEEGYEDVAYDHAGHLKHASNQEGYSGYLKNKDDGSKADKGKGNSGYGYEGQSKHGSNLSKGKKWLVDEGNNEQFDNKNSFSLKTGDYDHKNNDLTGAGSIKLSATNDNNKKNTSEDHFKPIYPKGSKHHKSKSTDSRLKKNQYANSDKNNSIKSPQKYSALTLPKDKHGYFARRPNATKEQSDVDVEIFDPNFDFGNGPKHGGNYHVHPTMLGRPKHNERLELLEPLNTPQFVNKHLEVVVNGHANVINKSKKDEKPPSVETATPSLNATSDDWVGLVQLNPRQQPYRSRDQYPNTSQVEIFRSDITPEKKHGGNYRRHESKSKSILYSELEDLENPSGGLHGGNYKTENVERGEDIETLESEKAASMEEGLPRSIVNNIAFLTSNMTVPN